jgi:hypothetical protein
MSRKFVLLSQNNYGGGLYVCLFVKNNSLKTTVFSDVTRKLMAQSYQRFIGTYYFRLQG